MMQFCAQRLLISKVFPKALFHAQTGVESSSSHSASTLWFIKVVCTLCIRKSNSLAVVCSDYFRKHLNPSIADGVIFHLSSRLNDPSLAFRVFSSSRLSLKLIHSQSTFDLLLRSLCEKGLHDSAIFVFKYMKEDGYFPNELDLDFLISSFAHAGKLKIAEEILIAKAEFCSEKGEVVSPFVHNKFLSLLVGRKQVDEALLFFRDHMLRLGSFRPDNYSFNIVIRGLCQAGKIEKAFEFIDVMKSLGCQPDIVMYNILINGFCRLGNVEKAQELLREVQTHPDFSPDSVTYTSVISGYCKLGKMDDASNILDEMNSCGIRPSMFTYNAIINGFAKKGEVKSALKMYERMVRSGFHPDVVTFTSLIDCHSRTGSAEQCLNLWKEMNGRKVTPNLYTFSVLINALCGENRLSEARDVLNKLNSRDDIIAPPFIYNPVIDGFCKSGNVDEANLIVAELQAKGCVHDKITYTILILGHCMKGRVLEAIGIFEKMLRSGVAPDNIMLTSLVACLRKAGMVREANAIERNATNTLHCNKSL